MTAPALMQTPRQAQPIAAPKFVDAKGAGIIAGRHVETIRQAARDGDLCGKQREGVNWRTHKKLKGAKWSFRPACVEAWVEGEPCEHQRTRIAPVPLDAFRSKRGNH